MSYFPLLGTVRRHRDFVAEKLAKYEVDDNGCWNFKGNLNSNGYGRFQVSGFKVFAHRIALAYHKGIEVGGYQVCHTCDNPSCINPDHLWRGTARQNMRDMVGKGRARRQDGFNNGNCKLTKDQVIEIKSMLSRGMDNKQIARLMPVSHSMVSRIRLGKSWANV